MRLGEPEGQGGIGALRPGQKQMLNFLCSAF